MAENGTQSPTMPKSLEGHTIPKERLDVVLPFVSMLSETAVRIGDTLPLEADPADFVRVLESEGE
jgi:hypothetical protein